MRIAVAGGTGTVGRYLAEAGEAQGHEVVLLSRSRGVDVRTGAGLAEALDGVDVVVDVTNPGGADFADPTAFFTDVARTLQGVGAERGVRHVVTLSIVGVDRAADYPYYAAKLAQERATAAGDVPSTVLRATQFHEFPAQWLARTRVSAEGGTEASVPDVRVRTVAARTVAEVLLEAAVAEPAGHAPDLAGPEEANLVDLATAFVAHRGEPVAIRPDRETMAGPAAHAGLPGPDARIEGPAFAEWLETDDAAALKI